VSWQSLASFAGDVAISAALTLCLIPTLVAALVPLAAVAPQRLVRTLSDRIPARWGHRALLLAGIAAFGLLLFVGMPERRRQGIERDAAEAAAAQWDATLEARQRLGAAAVTVEHDETERRAVWKLGAVGDSRPAGPLVHARCYGRRAAIEVATMGEGEARVGLLVPGVDDQHVARALADALRAAADWADTCGTAPRGTGDRPAR
jgi:hypothetical protein